MFPLTQLYCIRPATPADAKDILAIYAYYVENTAITFECKVPTLEEFTARIENTLQKYPYLVAEEDGQIIGYSYASAFHSREAYSHSVEVTVYVAPQMQRAGLGRQLYQTLEERLKKQNVFNLYACIAYPPEHEDEHLTYNSVRFHERMGYRMIGEFIRCGYKFDRFYSMVWMEKLIGNFDENPDIFLPFSQI